MEAANVKNMAIDIFATNVLHFGPTYSKTEMENLLYIIHLVLLQMNKKVYELITR